MYNIYESLRSGLECPLLENPAHAPTRRLGAHPCGLGWDMKKLWGVLWAKNMPTAAAGNFRWAYEYYFPNFARLWPLDRATWSLASVLTVTPQLFQGSRSSKAAFNHYSSSANGNVAEKLFGTQQQTRRGSLNFSYFCPPIDAAVYKCSDNHIWAPVVNLIKATSLSTLHFRTLSHSVIGVCLCCQTLLACKPGLISTSCTIVAKKGFRDRKRVVFLRLNVYGGLKYVSPLFLIRGWNSGCMIHAVLLTLA